LLEGKLGDVLIGMYEAAEQLRLARIASEEAERKRKEEEERKESRRKRYNAEVQRFNALLNVSEDYNAACKIRALTLLIFTLKKNC